jgi:hypothetical protein
LLFAGSLLAATALAAGTKYVTTAESFPPLATVSPVAECTGGRSVSAGGSTVNESGTQTLGQRPVDGADANDKPGDVFEARVRISGFGDLVTVHAVCTDDGQKVKTKKVIVDPEGTGCDAAPVSDVCTASRIPLCPKGTRVTGGGAFLESANGRIRASGPADGPDGDAAHDDGWLGAVNVQVPDVGSEQVTVYAICSKSPKGLKYVSESTIDGAPVSVECPAAHKVVGGGSSIESNGESTYVADSIPVDTDDANSKPDNGWGISAVGALGETVVVHAICRG